MAKIASSPSVDGDPLQAKPGHHAATRAEYPFPSGTTRPACCYPSQCPPKGQQLLSFAIRMKFTIVSVLKHHCPFSRTMLCCQLRWVSASLRSPSPLERNHCVQLPLGVCHLLLHGLVQHCRGSPLKEVILTLHALLLHDGHVDLHEDMECCAALQPCHQRAWAAARAQTS